jgi:hypothetical protein
MPRTVDNSHTREERDEKARLDREEVRLKAVIDSPETSNSLLVSAKRELRFLVKERDKLEKQITERRQMVDRKAIPEKRVTTIDVSADPRDLTDIELARTLRTLWWVGCFSDEEGTPKFILKQAAKAEAEKRWGAQWFPTYEKIAQRMV